MSNMQQGNNNTNQGGSTQLDPAVLDCIAEIVAVAATNFALLSLPPQPQQVVDEYAKNFKNVLIVTSEEGSVNIDFYYYKYLALTPFLGAEVGFRSEVVQKFVKDWLGSSPLLQHMEVVFGNGNYRRET